VARQLVHARRPVIIAENAGRDPVAVTSLVALAEVLGIPVFESSLPYTSSFPRNSPLYMGVNVAGALREADVVFVVDSVTPWYPPAAGPPDSAKVICLDEAPLHERLPFWGYHVDTAITAPAAPALEVLVDLVRRETAGVERPDYLKRRQYWQDQHDEMAAQLEREAMAGREKKPIAARWFLRAAAKSLPADSILVDETIMHTRVVHAYLAEPGRYIKAAYGGLGVGMGEALGVKLARPDRPVVLMIGDGAFNYNPALAALGLGQEYGLPVLIIIFDNGGYQAMKWGHQRLYPQGIAMTRDVYLGVDITPAPDYIKIAAAFGAYGERLEDPGDIEAAIKRCLERTAGGNTALLDVALETAPPFATPPPRV
jgi:acetolactate synthase-1/2/3 large subunit